MQHSQDRRGIRTLTVQILLASTLDALFRLVFQQTEEPFGWLVHPIRVFLDEFPDATVHRLGVELGIRLLDPGLQVGPAQTLRVLIEQFERCCIDSLGDFV